MGNPDFGDRITAPNFAMFSSAAAQREKVWQYAASAAISMEVSKPSALSSRLILFHSRFAAASR